MSIRHVNKSSNFLELKLVLITESNCNFQHNSYSIRVFYISVFLIYSSSDVDLRRHCVEGLARPFIVPGSQLLFCQKLYITVVAHTPFLLPDGQVVLVAGWLLTQDNVDAFVELVQRQLGPM